MSTVAEREIYPNAPVVLVALEVRHPIAGPLSYAERLTIKDRLAERLPIMRTPQLTSVQSAVSMQAGASIQGALSASAPQMRTEEFAKFFSRDNATAVSMLPGAVTIETTRYVRWEYLRELAAAALTARHEVGSIDGIERLGLRYIDEIRVPSEPESGWEQWVDNTLVGPTRVGEKLGLRPTQWQGVTVFESGPDRTLALRYGPREGYAVDPGGDLKRPTPTPGPFFLMDIDSFWTPSDRIPEFDVELLLTVCNELHEPVRGLFENLIKPRLRKEVLRRAE